MVAQRTLVDTQVLVLKVHTSTRHWTARGVREPLAHNKQALSARCAPLATQKLVPAGMTVPLEGQAVGLSARNALSVIV